MKIFKLKKTFTIGFNGINHTYCQGELFCEEEQKWEGSDKVRRFFYPFTGASAIQATDEEMEFVEETNFPKDYYTVKKYTEHQLQNAIKEFQSISKMINKHG